MELLLLIWLSLFEISSSSTRTSSWINCLHPTPAKLKSSSYCDVSGASSIKSSPESFLAGVIIEFCSITSKWSIFKLKAYCWELSIFKLEAYYSEWSIFRLEAYYSSFTVVSMFSSLDKVYSFILYSSDYHWSLFEVNPASSIT